ncbi:MAG: TonB-dependent receptor [Pseudomonadota bacterium]
MSAAMLTVVTSLTVGAAHAQSAPTPQPEDQLEQAEPADNAATAPQAPLSEETPEELDVDVVVTASQPRGAVITDIPPIEELDTDDIASYGAASLEELVANIAPQTNSGRGRGTGRPAVLLNGRRISGFRELRDFPPEAIKRVQIFPEELAVSYGFRPDQRVINFILVDNYSSIAMDSEYGIATQGGRGQGEIGATLTNINGGNRLVLDVEYQGATALRESERAIIQPEIDPTLTTVDSDPDDAAAFRTLLPSRERIEANATAGFELSPGTSLTLNATYGTDDTVGQNGLNAPVFAVGADNVFNPSGNDISLLRLLNDPRTLLQLRDVETIQLATSLNGRNSGVIWSLTGNYDRVETTTRIDRLADVTGLQQAITDGTLDAFTPVLGAGLPPPEQDVARSAVETFSVKGTASLRPLTLGTGDVQMTVDGEFTDLSLTASDSTVLGFASSNLGRTIGAALVNLEVPLAERDGINGAIGRLSINGNFGLSELSDFGTLTRYGFGFNWEPLPGWTLQASFIGSETAPTVNELGDPVIITPNVPIFDFTNNQTVLAQSVTGGNADLLREEQRDVKIGLTWRPEGIDGLRVIAEFFRNRSFDTTAAFPTLTPEVEAAFPDRVVRDAAGTLVQLDQRPVNFAQISSDSLRYGVNFSKRIGQRGGRGRGGPPGRPPGAQPGGVPSGAGAPSAGSRPRAGPPGGRPAQAGEPPRGRRGGGPPFRRPRFGRWNISVFHRIRFTETVLVAPGIEEFDLLNGSSISGAGGVPRHSVELEGGWFYNGLGARITGNFEGGTRVDGVGGSDDSSLEFNPIATVNMRFFVNFDNRTKLTEKFPILKGVRLSLRVNNLFDAQQNVRDAQGNVPLRFQPGFVDPVGRFIELDIRKRF